jgi:predicted peptidase
MARRGNLAVAGLAILVSAPLPAADYSARTFSAPDGGRLNYRIHVPEAAEPEAPWPLVLFLHGAGERGDDNQLQLIHGAFDILDFTVESDNPAVILAPQCPADERWVDVDWDAPTHRMAENPSAPMQMVMALLEATLADLPVDRQRVYVTGLSMGGYGAWEIVQRRPGLFAAAIPICGGGDPALADSISHLPLWVFHGADDPIVPVRRSLDMVAALQAAGGQPSYTIYGGAGHDAWTRTYANAGVLQWLFDQERMASTGAEEADR